MRRRSHLPTSNEQRMRQTGKEQRNHQVDFACCSLRLSYARHEIHANTPAPAPAPSFVILLPYPSLFGSVPSKSSQEVSRSARSRSKLQVSWLFKCARYFQNRGHLSHERRSEVSGSNCGFESRAQRRAAAIQAQSESSIYARASTPPRP